MVEKYAKIPTSSPARCMKKREQGLDFLTDTYIYILRLDDESREYLSSIASAIFDRATEF